MKNKKSIIIISICCIVAGAIICGISFVANDYKLPRGKMFMFSFYDEYDNDKNESLEYEDYEKKSVEISDEFDEIKVHGGPELDVIIKPSSNNRDYVEYYDTKKLTHRVSVERGTLVVSCKDDRKNVSVELKNNQKIEIVVYTTKTQFKSIDVYSTSGDILVSDIASETTDLANTSGDITVEALQGTKLSVQNTSGDVIMEDVTLEEAEIVSTSGDILGENVVLDKRLDVNQCSGDVDFEEVSAKDINVVSVSGTIKLKLLEDETYRYRAESLSGSVLLPPSDNNSDRNCSLSTYSGDCIVEY